MRDANPIRTLGNYSKPSHEGYRNTIELIVGNNVVPLRTDTIRIHHHMGGSYYSFPCSIISTRKDCKTPQRYPDVPTTSRRIFLRSMDSFQGLTPKSPSLWNRSLASNSIFYDHVSFHLKCELDGAANSKLCDKMLTNLGKSLRTSPFTTMRTRMTQRNSSNQSRLSIHLKWYQEPRFGLEISWWFSGSESRPPMLNKENYVPWSSRLLRYAKSRPNGKLINNSIINGPYVRRMIPEPGDTNRKVPVNETFYVLIDDELTEKELKQIEADDQAI
nr:ribonuclease H-like domain-containing protein [Tanacetum cinerariifolium]